MKRLKFKTIILTSILAAQFTTLTFANFTTYSQNETSTVLMDGLIYKKIEKATNEGFLDIYILDYDINNPNVALDILRNPSEWSKRAKLTDMMVDKSVLAGINASFFDTSAINSDILGIEYENGKLVYAKNEYNKTVANANSLRQKNDGSIDFGYISNSITLATEEGKTVYINSINGVQDFENATIFTGNVISNTAKCDEKFSLYKIVMQNGIVVRIDPPKVPTTLAIDEIALVTKDESLLELFPIGSGVIYNVSTNLGEDIANYELVLSGGGTLIKDGQFYNDGISVSASSNAPRTAVGTTEDGRLISIAVDGRGSSVGVSYEELASILLELGVTNAINLDGGGSTEIATINHNNSVVINNTPSDGKERNISNGLGFISNVDESERILTKIEVVPNNSNLFINNSTSILLIGYDQYNRAYYLSDESGEYSIEGINADIKGNILTPSSGGVGIIHAKFQELESSAIINVYDSGKDLTLIPAKNSINIDSNTKLSSTITSFDNTTLDIDLNTATITVSDPDLGYVNNGVFYSLKKSGTANILVEYAGLKKNAFIKINKPVEEVTVVAEKAKKEEPIVTYTYKKNFSSADNKYIPIENTNGMPEIAVFGRMEINDTFHADYTTNAINDLSKNSSLRIFSGGIQTPKGMAIGKSNLNRNKFDNTDYPTLQTKIINLETFTSNSYNIVQLNAINTALSTNTMNNVIIQNSDPTFNYLENTRFNNLFRKTLNEYVKNTGVNIYLINGNTNKDNINVDNLDAVTYIQIPKQFLSEKTSNAIGNKLYFYLDNNILKYSFKN